MKTPNVELELQKFKAGYQEKDPKESIDINQRDAHLIDFYKVPPASGKDDPALFRQQAIALCDAMEKAGMQNFAGLRKKFPENANPTPMMMSMKETMENIFYVMHHHPSRSFDNLMNDFKDRVFICEEGTLTNLQVILGELTGAIGFDPLIISVKRAWIEQITRDTLIKGQFIECDPSLPGMEIHYISSLVNVVADEYHLLKKTEEEDKYLVKIGDESANILRDELNKKLQNPEAIDGFLDMLVSTIAGMIPEYDEEKYPKKNEDDKIGYAYSEAIDEIVGRYGLNAGSDKLIARKDGLEMGLKPQYQELTKHALIVKLHDQGVIKHPHVEFSRELLALEPDMIILDNNYNTVKVNVCDEDCWKKIQSSPYKKQFHDYLLKYNFTLEEEIIIDWRKKIPEDIKNFVRIYALRHSDKELIKMYLIDSTDINSLFSEALHLEKQETIEWFLSKYPTQLDNKLLCAAFKKACLNGNDKIFNMFQSNTELFSKLDKFAIGNGFINASMTGNLAFIKRLLTPEWLAHIEPLAQEIAFINVASRGHIEILNEMLNHANITIQPQKINEGFTNAARNGKGDILRALIQRAELSPDTIHTAFRNAILRNHNATIETMLEFPIIYESDDAAFYCLQHATMHGNASVITKLLNVRSLSDFDPNRLSPILIDIVRNNRTNIMNILVAHTPTASLHPQLLKDIFQEALRCANDNIVKDMLTLNVISQDRAFMEYCFTYAASLGRREIVKHIQNLNLIIPSPKIYSDAFYYALVNGYIDIAADIFNVSSLSAPEKSDLLLMLGKELENQTLKQNRELIITILSSNTFTIPYNNLKKAFLTAMYYQNFEIAEKFLELKKHEITENMLIEVAKSLLTLREYEPNCDIAFKQLFTLLPNEVITSDFLKNLFKFVIETNQIGVLYNVLENSEHKQMAKGIFLESFKENIKDLFAFDDDSDCKDKVSNLLNCDLLLKDKKFIITLSKLITACKSEPAAHNKYLDTILSSQHISEISKENAEIMMTTITENIDSKEFKEGIEYISRAILIKARRHNEPLMEALLESPLVNHISKEDLTHCLAWCIKKENQTALSNILAQNDFSHLLVEQMQSALSKNKTERMSLILPYIPEELMSNFSQEELRVIQKLPKPSIVLDNVKEEAVKQSNTREITP